MGFSRRSYAVRELWWYVRTLQFNQGFLKGAFVPCRVLVGERGPLGFNSTPDGVHTVSHDCSIRFGTVWSEGM